MRRYHLRILYPSSNRVMREQYYTKIVESTSFSTNSLNYVFWKYPNETVAVYPIAYTIIELIENIKE